LRFLFFDRILALEPGKHALSTKAITVADEFLTEHYALRPLMPATLTMECVAQLAGWLYIVTEDFGITTVLALAQGIEVLRHPRPGDTLTVEVWVDYAHRGGATLRGEARIGEETILRTRRLVFASQPSRPEDAVTTRALFAYMSGGFDLETEVPA
jgi:3-hydroxyacyl-[acyl-carrier-protein] dehydratase